MTLRPASGAVVDNRRRFGRRVTFKPAKIVLASGQSISCAVINVSEGGALIQLRGAECNEMEFQLLIMEDDMLVACRVAHRADGNIGVCYTRLPRRASRVGTSQSERARALAWRVLGQGTHVDQS